MLGATGEESFGIYSVRRVALFNPRIGVNQDLAPIELRTAGNATLGMDKSSRTQTESACGNIGLWM
jgi:hypothetical protein